MKIHFRLLLTSTCLLFAVFLSAQDITDLPPMEAGKCYAKCIVPDEYSTVDERMETRGGYKRLEIAEPQYETITEEVMIQAPSYQLVAVPAEYGTEEERIMIKEASKRYVYTAAVYETESQQMLISEESKRLIPVPGKFETFTNSMFYYGTKDGLSTEYGDLLDPNNPNNPNNPNSPFNPNNPKSPYNANNPDSPLNPSSPYNPNNPSGLWSPTNPQSPFHPDNAGKQIPDDFLIKSQIGTIMPYLTKETTFEVERMPAEYATETDRIEVAAASAHWERRNDANCKSPDGDCTTMCYVEVPAEYQTITKTVNKGCATGYFLAGKGADGRDECARVRMNGAQYGARTIMTVAPSYREEVIPAKYKTVKIQKVKTPASMQEIDVAAEYDMVEKRVVKRAAYTRYEKIPGKYKTVTRRVRKGLKGLGYTDAQGYMVNFPNGTKPGDGKDYPFIISPNSGYPMTSIPNSGMPNGGDPYALGANGMPTGSNPADLAGYYSAGCPSGFGYDTRDGLCKKITEIPAEFATITKTIVKSAGNKTTQWEEVVCPTKATGNTTLQVQRALKNKGYDPGPIDGVMGSQTKSALAKFQNDNKLPLGGMNIQTLKALGVKY